MILLKNIGLFFLVYIPAMAVASMLLQLVPAIAQRTPAEWEVGWNPMLWLIVATPWQVPVVVLVPVLHFIARRVSRRQSLAASRRLMLVCAPVFFLAGNVVLWGVGNLLELALPVLCAGVVYGAVLRIPRSSRPLPSE